MESLAKSRKLKIFLSLSLAVVFLLFLFSNTGNKIYAEQKNITVFIDPGHGGSDPGCVHNGLNEKDVNLTVSLKLKSKLEQNGYNVVISRTTDVYRSLDERVDMANSSGSDIFLSIHGNASLNPDANGTETFWSSSGASGSSQFATSIQKNLVKSINRRDRGVKTADFRVIKYAKMTSALVEYVFLSNPEEAQLLKSDAFLNKIVDGIFNGIEEYSVSIITEKKILMDINCPKDSSIVSATAALKGWAVESSATADTGITKIHVYDGPYSGTSDNFLGSATYGLARPDVAAYFGKENYTNSGYSLDIDTTKLTNGQHIIYVYAYNPDIGWKYMVRKVNVSNDAPAEKKILMYIDKPSYGETISGSYTVAGWAADLNSTSGTGIDSVKVYLDGAMESGTLLGDAAFCSRPDVAAYFGNSELTNSGFKLTWDTTAISEGNHTLYVYAHSPTYGWIYSTRKVNVEGLTNKMGMRIDKPSYGETISGSYTVAGWAADLNSTSGTGIDSVKVYLDGAMESGTLLGDAAFCSRPDVAAYFGNSELTNSGFKLTWDTTAISEGNHTLYVYAHSPTYGWIYSTRKVNVEGLTNKMGMRIDKPSYGETISGSYTVAGWALDLNSTSGTGIDSVKVYLDGVMESGTLLGDAAFCSRPDVAAYFGNSELTNSGFKLTWDTTAISEGNHTLYVYAHSPTYGWIYSTRKVNVSNDAPAEKKILMYIDKPSYGETISGSYTVAGWALDLNSTSGTGIDSVKVYLDGAMESGTLLGDAAFCSRPDVAAYFGNSELTNSGFKLTWDTTAISEGNHTLYVYAHSPTYGWIYSTRKVNVSNGVIDNSTNVIGKASATEEQLLSLFVSRNSNQIDRARRLAPLYIKWGNTFNIRYDIAWAQMCHETGFLQFGGIVPPEANNFCGLGATGAKDADGNYVYNSFATEELGIIAHYIHLAWYVYPNHLTLTDSEGDLYCSTKYDPRHFGTGHNYNGDSTLGTLNERWAPSTTYTAKIIQFGNEIYN